MGQKRQNESIFLVFESLVGVELPVNIKWETRCSNVTEVSHFSSDLCHPVSILVSCKTFPPNSPPKQISTKQKNISCMTERK